MRQGRLRGGGGRVEPVVVKPWSQKIPEPSGLSCPLVEVHNTGDGAAGVSM